MFRNQRIPILFYASTTCLVALVVGCSSGDGRLPIHGVVTLDGKPLADAAISFQAAGDRGNSSGAVLNKHGAFSIPTAKGLLPGRYAVNVQVWRETNRTYLDPHGKTVKITAPVRFKETGKLFVNVATDGANRFELPLTSAP